MPKHQKFKERFGFGLENLIAADDMVAGRRLYKEFVRREDYFSQEGFSLWYSYFFGEPSPSYSDLQLNQKLLVKRFVDFEKQKGDYALIWSIGFPKYYNEETLKEVLDKEVGLSRIKLATLCGSKKPHSDIDLFLVGDIESYGNGYLDIYGLNYEKFMYFVSNLDFSVTTGLFGKPIIGEEEINHWRDFVLGEPVNELMIMHNQNRADGEYNLLPQLQRGTREYETSTGYVVSYRKCAEELKKGNKILTLDTLGGKEAVRFLNELPGDLRPL